MPSEALQQTLRYTNRPLHKQKLKERGLLLQLDGASVSYQTSIPFIICNLLRCRDSSTFNLLTSI